MVRAIIILLGILLLAGCADKKPSSPAKPILVHSGQVLELRYYYRSTGDIRVGWSDEKSTGVATYKTHSADLYKSLMIGTKVRIYEQGGKVEGLIKEGSE